MTIFEVLKESNTTAAPFRRKTWPELQELRLVDCSDEFRAMSFQFIGINYNPKMGSFLKPAYIKLEDLLADDWELSAPQENDMKNLIPIAYNEAHQYVSEGHAVYNRPQKQKRLVCWKIINNELHYKKGIEDTWFKGSPTPQQINGQWYIQQTK